MGAKMMMMKSAMKASMKMKKSMKAMVMKKAMKKRAMKKTAKSYKTTAGARAAVFSGKIMKSKGGLKKEAFTKSKTGKIVSKKASANGKKAYKRISKWTAAVQKARTLWATRASSRWVARAARALLC